MQIKPWPWPSDRYTVLYLYYNLKFLEMGEIQVHVGTRTQWSDYLM